MNIKDFNRDLNEVLIKHGVHLDGNIRIIERGDTIFFNDRDDIRLSDTGAYLSIHPIIKPQENIKKKLLSMVA